MLEWVKLINDTLYIMNNIWLFAIFYELILARF